MADKPGEEDSDILFSAAFAEHSSDEPPKEDPPKEDPPKEDPPKEDPPKEDPPKEDPPKEDPPKEDPPKEDPPKPPVAKAPPQKSEEQIRADIESERVETERKASIATRATLTPEETTLRAEIAKDFPDVAKVLEVQERTFQARLEQAVEQEGAKIRAEVAPLATATQHMARNAHEAAILDSHADAITILPAVETWVNTQPVLLKNAYNAALDKGSAADVAEVLTAYKATLTPAPTEKSAEELAAAQQVLDDAEAARVLAEKKKQEKLDAMGGVKKQSQNKTDDVDADDFKGGFDAVANAK